MIESGRGDYMNLGIEGRAALVSGASAGLGKAAALSLAREGARVSLCSRDKKRAEEAARQIAGWTGREAIGMACDIEDARDAKRWVSESAARLGSADILVCNAGGPPPGAFSEVGDEEWREGFERNLLAQARLCRLALPRMKKARWGRIVFIASTSAKQPVEGLVISNALRTGILGLAKTLANELGPYGITVNTVCPGYTATERLEELVGIVSKKKGLPPKAVRELWAEGVPLKRIARPEEIGDAVAFLCSERAAYITGTALVVDGGRVSSPF